MNSPEATCIGCGCTDSNACPLGCAWLRVDREAGLGVCTECPQTLPLYAGAVRLLRVLRETGPRKRSVCEGLVGPHHYRAVVLALERRELVRGVGDRKGWRLSAVGTLGAWCAPIARPS